jgi:hypothetical protein
VTQLVLPRELAAELSWIDAPCVKFVDDWEDAKTYGVTEVVENRHTGQEKRWTSIHELVIRTKDGALWRRLYERGLTERQFQEPFETEGELIPFDQVKPRPKSVIEYVPFD